MVSCPLCKGIFPISQGDESLKDDGRAVAYHGCKVACGAMLISSQMHTTTVPSSGAAPGGADAAAEEALDKGFGAIGHGMVAGYQEEALDDSGEHFRGRFQVLDLETGEPIAGQSVRLRAPGGQCFGGSTDAEGFTQWVERHANETLAFDLSDSEQA